MDTGLKITLIAALAQNGIIGRENRIPWKLKDDMKHFREITTGKPILMGRKTYESIGRPLPNRENIILTRQGGYLVPGCVVLNSWDSVLAHLGYSGELMVLGGSEIYNLALPYADEMYLTAIEADIDGDTIFPPFELLEWDILQIAQFEANDRNEYPFEILRYIRKRLVYLPNARFPDQLEVMSQILSDGVCPFCQENFSRYHLGAIVAEGDAWFVCLNQWPYSNTRAHVLVISKQHVESPDQLSESAQLEFWHWVKWAKKEYKIQGGGVAMRFGDPRFNGASVYHLHAHLMTVEIIDKNNPAYQKLRVRLG